MPTIEVVTARIYYQLQKIKTDLKKQFPEISEAELTQKILKARLAYLERTLQNGIIEKTIAFEKYKDYVTLRREALETIRQKNVKKAALTEEEKKIVEQLKLLEAQFRQGSNLFAAITKQIQRRDYVPPELKLMTVINPQFAEELYAQLTKNFPERKFNLEEFKKTSYQLIVMKFQLFDESHLLNLNQISMVSLDEKATKVGFSFEEESQASFPQTKISKPVLKQTSRAQPLIIGKGRQPIPPLPPEMTWSAKTQEKAPELFLEEHKEEWVSKIPDLLNFFNNQPNAYTVQVSTLLAQMEEAAQALPLVRRQALPEEPLSVRSRVQNKVQEARFTILVGQQDRAKAQQIKDEEKKYDEIVRLGKQPSQQEYERLRAKYLFQKIYANKSSPEEESVYRSINLRTLGIEKEQDLLNYDIDDIALIRLLEREVKAKLVDIQRDNIEPLIDKIKQAQTALKAKPMGTVSTVEKHLILPLNSNLQSPITLESSTERSLMPSNQGAILSGTSFRTIKTTDNKFSAHRGLDGAIGGAQTDASGRRQAIYGGVADGQGGHMKTADGEKLDQEIASASAKAVEVALQVLNACKDPKEVIKRKTEIIDTVAKSIQHDSLKSGENGQNTTLACFRTFEGPGNTHQIVGINIGDSMVVSYNPFTQTFRTLAPAKITARQAPLGFPSERNPEFEDVFQSTLQDGEIVFALTDGIWEYLPTEKDPDSPNATRLKASAMCSLLSTVKPLSSPDEFIGHVTAQALENTDQARESLRRGTLGPKIRQQIEQYEAIYDEGKGYYNALNDILFVIERSRSKEEIVNKMRELQNKPYFLDDKSLQNLQSKIPQNLPVLINPPQTQDAQQKAFKALLNLERDVLTRKIFSGHTPDELSHATKELQRNLEKVGDDVTIVGMRVPIKPLEALRVALEKPHPSHIEAAAKMLTASSARYDLNALFTLLENDHINNDKPRYDKAALYVLKGAIFNHPLVIKQYGAQLAQPVIQGRPRIIRQAPIPKVATGASMQPSAPASADAAQLARHKKDKPVL